MCFDVDSTVCLDEGIDELAEYCGAGKAVAEWTARLDLLLELLSSVSYCGIFNSHCSSHPCQGNEWFSAF